ncbi:prefoldin subunit alpha [Candidatus Pacearchaeota archaeon]|nr:prefoldin subunit alpha [Candidatus Pacearchaeota archaeon]
MDPQALFMQASQIEQQSQQAQQHLQMIEEQIKELDDFKSHLDSLKGKKDQELLAGLGKGVFVKTDLTSDQLYVNVGSGVVVQKTPDQAKTTIDSQIKQLQEARLHITAQIETMNQQLMSLFQEVQKAQEKEEKQEKKK